MVLSALDWCIIGLFLMIILTIGVLSSRQAGKSLSNFFLGGRDLPWYWVGVSMVATTFAADTPLAVTELVATKGIAGNWLWWNALAGGMLTVFFFARLWRRSGVLTEVELIELRYSGKSAAFLRGFKAVYLGLFMNMLVIGWVNLAMTTVLQVFFDLTPTQALLGTAGLMLIVVTYSTMAGLVGIVLTDMLQFVMAMIGCILLAVFVVNSPQIGGLDALLATLQEQRPDSLNFFPSIGEAAGGALFGLSLGAFVAHLGVQWWASWYPGSEPGGGGYVAQRILSAKDEKHAVYATLLFQIAHYCIRPWPWIVVALCSLVLYPELSGAETKFGFVYVMRDFLPAGLKGLLFVSFVAAYMSTISTQLNWGASYLLNDLYKRFIARERSQRHYVAWSRIFSVLLMLIGLAVTTLLESVSGAWAFLIECGAGLGLVLILRWYWWRINVWSEIVASLAPFLGYAVAHFILDWSFPNSFFFTVGLTTLAWLLATLLTPAETDTTLERFYRKVHPGGRGWRKIRLKLGMPDTGANQSQLVVAWLSSIVLVYSALFFIGKLLFKEWSTAAVCLLLGLVAWVVLRRALHNTRLLD